jgi:Na+-translocating ferredoxin:NAD+ oxidoreductase subunit G
MNKVVKLALVLFLVCAVVAGILGAVNLITADKIAEQDALTTKAAYAAVLAADSYEDVEFDPTAEGFETIDKIVKADGDKGYVVTTTFSGAQGSITMAVGVDMDYKCTGISIISHSETSGLGAKAADTGEFGTNWRAEFVGEGDDIAITKKGGNIDAITAATITSNAVTGAVSTSIKAVESLG